MNHSEFTNLADFLSTEANLTGLNIHDCLFSPTPLQPTTPAPSVPWLDSKGYRFEARSLFGSQYYHNDYAFVPDCHSGVVKRSPPGSYLARGAN